MKKNLTLIEVILVIVVMGILLSMVSLKFTDMKKDALTAKITSNINLLQTAVDRYSLDKNGEKPIRDGEIITLENPQIIDVEKLYPKYIKSKTDYQNIQKEYYWVDIFGTVWGATIDTPVDLVMNDGQIEFTLPENVEGYSIYEVSGYGIKTKANEKSYKKVNTRTIGGEKTQIQIPLLKNEEKKYLFSTIDQYGLETASVGLNYRGKDSMQPIMKGVGEYMFEISSFEQMYWEKFSTIQDTPGNSKIEYMFSVKDEAGVYGEFNDDFYSLKDSTGIQVKINMIADGENKPSIYDMRVFYRFKDEEKLTYPKVSVDPPEAGWVSLGGSSEPHYDSWTDIQPIPNESGDTSEGSSTGSEGSTSEPTVCGLGGSKTNVDYDGKILTGELEARIVYSFTLPEGQSIESVTTPQIMVGFDYFIKKTQFEYSKDASEFIKANSLASIPEGSCVKIAYTIMPYDSWTSSTPPSAPIAVPEVKTTSEKPKVISDPPSVWSINPPTTTNEPKTPVAVGGVPNKPAPTDAEVLDTNWETVDTMRFFAHSGDGQITRWISAAIIDSKPINTRILYRYSTSDGYYWSEEVESLSSAKQSRSLLVTAYLQVDKDYVNNPIQAKPSITSVKINHERGVQDLSLTKPTATIMPIKDNNLGRDVISDDSVIEWTYETFDPRKRKITAVEWAGDKREKYPVGTYEVRLRVMNESSIWSEWIIYKFDVKQEKPIAIIKEQAEAIENNDPIVWESISTDPDGDIIKNKEWRGDIANKYAIGNYKIELRVQDSDGNWSDWVSKDFSVLEKSYLIYRAEAEDVNKVILYGNGTISRPAYAGASGNGIFQSSLYSDASNSIYHTFNGTGVDIKFISSNNLQILVDNVLVKTHTNAQPNTYSIRNLPLGNHTVRLTLPSRSGGTMQVDYFDVYSHDNTPIFKNVFTRTVDSIGSMSDSNNNNIIPERNTKSKTFYTLVKNSHVSINVRKDGKFVKELLSNEFQTGGTLDVHNIMWDGTNKEGDFVGTGMYTLEIKATSESGISTVFNESLYVDNDKPIYRVEAEDSTKAILVGNGTIARPTYAGASANQVLSTSITSDATNYVYHTFNGTGLDIKTMAANKMQIQIDNVIYDTFTKSSENIYSIRNLPLGNHTVKLVLPSRSGSSMIVDYFDIYSSNDQPAITNVYPYSINKVGYQMPLVDNRIMTHLGTRSNIHYTLSKNSHVTVSIKDGETLVNKLQDRVFITGGTFDKHSIVWDGKDSDGNTVPTGSYTVEIKATGIVGTSTYHNSQTIYVDNSIPISRLEGEDAKVITNGYGTITRPTYTGASGGKILYSTVSSDAVNTTTATFNGTGIDISLINSNNMDVYVDNVFIKKITTGSPYIFSIRGLSQGNHTLKLVLASRSAGVIRLDYLDIYE